MKKIFFVFLVAQFVYPSCSYAYYVKYIGTVNRKPCYEVWGQRGDKDQFGEVLKEEKMLGTACPPVSSATQNHKNEDIQDKKINQQLSAVTPNIQFQSSQKQNVEIGETRFQTISISPKSELGRTLLQLDPAMDLSQIKLQKKSKSIKSKKSFN